MWRGGVDRRCNVRWAALAASALVVAACGGGGSDADDVDPAAANPAATQPPIPSPTTTGLAGGDAVPSSTVVPPSLPSPCVVASMMFLPAGSGAVQVMNHAPDQCELDLTGTAALSPESEPTVWIDSGATIELQLEAGGSCDTPIENLPLMVSGTPFEVTLLQPTCDPTIVAVYPLD